MVKGGRRGERKGKKRGVTPRWDIRIHLQFHMAGCLGVGGTGSREGGH